MTIEHTQLILQIISVIGVPILTAAIAWITNSLRKMNKRIDEVEKLHYSTRLEDMERRTELSNSIRAMETKQEANLREMHGIRSAIDRIETWLLNNK